MLTTKQCNVTASQQAKNVAHSSSMTVDRPLYVGDEVETPLTLNNRPCAHVEYTCTAVITVTVLSRGMAKQCPTHAQLAQGCSKTTASHAQHTT